MFPNLSNLVFKLNGYEVYSDPNLLIDEEDVVELSWKERLLSWPWTPWKSKYVVKMTVADPKVYKYGNIFVAHPYTVTIMTQEIVDKINFNPE